MSDLCFAGASGQPDRRRRLLAQDVANESGVVRDSADGLAADRSVFMASSLLSRDKLIRRVFSPRVWKHGVVAAVLVLVPLVLGLAWLVSDLRTQPERRATFARIETAVRYAPALALFVSAQLALLIGWVRSASAVDFRGRFRSWHWLSGLLFAGSAMMLTDTFSLWNDLAAASLQPVLGEIRAARPALLIVPLTAVLAIVMWFVVPDMSRCRTAQLLLLGGLLVTAVSVSSGLSSSLGMHRFLIAVLNLLAANLVVASMQLHARFVIHVNPNPPEIRRATLTSTIMLSPKVETSQLQKAVVDSTPVTRAIRSNVSQPIVAKTELVELPLAAPAELRTSIPLDQAADRPQQLSKKQRKAQQRLKAAG